MKDTRLVGIPSEKKVTNEPRPPEIYYMNIKCPNCDFTVEADIPKYTTLSYWLSANFRGCENCGVWGPYEKA